MLNICHATLLSAGVNTYTTLYQEWILSTTSTSTSTISLCTILASASILSASLTELHTPSTVVVAEGIPPVPCQLVEKARSGITSTLQIC